jgi:cell division protein ZapA
VTEAVSKNAAESREPESHEVVLLGKKYKLRSQHDDEYLAKLAHFVTGQVAEVQRRGAVSTLDAALLAALNIADEYFRHRLDAETRLAEVGEKTQSLLAALDELEPIKPGAPEPVPDPDDGEPLVADDLASRKVDVSG